MEDKWSRFGQVCSIRPEEIEFHELDSFLPKSMENNRAWNSKNPYQGKFKRVLCVCSAGLLRSPTIAWMLSNNPWHFNTRAVGLDVGHALIPCDEVLLDWADEIVCMDEYQEKVLKERTQKPVHNLRIGDNFEYRDKGLIHIASLRLGEIFKS